MAKKELTAMIKIGDWVTQYSAGYWQVLDIGLPAVHR